MGKADAKTVESSGQWPEDTNDKSANASGSPVYYSCDRRESSEDTVKNGGLVGSSLTRKRTQQDLYENIKENADQVQEPNKKPANVGTQSEPKTSTASTTSIAATTPSPISASASSSSPASASFIPEPPDWNTNKTAWGFLQALRKDLKSGYLDRQAYNGSHRTGYLIGRYEGCDFVIEKSQISKRHCLIYVESGNDGHCKGISVYLEDLSSNGTFVNGKKVGQGNRVLLKTGDRIQLYRNDTLAEDDPRNVYYRLILPPLFEVGTFHEEYILQGQLGKGSFAAVYKATHKRTGRRVAVKVLQKARFASKPKLLPSIVQEVGILMSLEAHPCVIQIERVFNEPKYIYLILEYVEKGEIFEYVLKRGKLSEHEARFIMWQLFLAIQFLHDRGIAHRDLKPENVLLVNSNNLHIKVTDFGLAKVQHGCRPFVSQCGTPNYVAPEVLESAANRAYGKECDLWSLGVMLYIFLCGFPPFNDDLSPPPMKEQIKKGLYDFPSPHWDVVSDEAKDLVQRLLTVNPVKRISIEDALTHPWMQLDTEIMDDMRNNLDPSVLSVLRGDRFLNLPATQSLTQSFGSLPL